MKFDYVIIGGGSAGCVLASRLSEDVNTTVCLLEAGGQGRSALVKAPAGTILMMPGRPKINNWAFETTPQPGLNWRKGYQPRGKCLGGSSAINAMLYVRGHSSDYDHWADNGADGWSYEEVLPYFKRAENFEHGENSYHGADGPLSVGDQQSPRPISKAFIDAVMEFQVPYNEDFNGINQEGVGLYHVTQFHDQKRNGQRCSAAAAYLHPIMERPNLTVITGATTSKILIDDQRAKGVEYIVNNERRRVDANKEVLLSAGAFGSPQLLMMSGIGAADHLREHDIPVVKDLPGVGQNLQDHLDFILSFRSKDRNMLGIGAVGGLQLTKNIAQWAKDGTGMIASPYTEVGAFIKSSPSEPCPDLQLHFVIALVDDHARKLHYGYGFSCHVCVLRPKSRGVVALNSTNPMEQPMIDPKFLSDESDVQKSLAGAKLTREMMLAEPMKPYRAKEMYTCDNMSDVEWIDHIRSRADTIYHPIGTCKMGKDDMAVVDPQLKVRGVDGLRVIDASVMPTLIGGNTNAPTIMIAEKAVDMILPNRVD